MTIEFFLAGHLEAFRENFGAPHDHHYDNLKTVVRSRRPQLVLNSQFIDFSRHYGFTIHPCTPCRAKEDGRVERVIRGIRSFLNVEAFTDLQELNRRMDRWCRQRNATVHRSTGRTPSDMVLEESLKAMLAITCLPRRTIAGANSRAGFIIIETKRYSAPSRFRAQACVILAYLEPIEIVVGSTTAAPHRRSFGVRQKLELPANHQALLRIIPHYRQERILQLITNLDLAMSSMLAHGSNAPAAAHALSRLLVRHRKPMFLSALREPAVQQLFRVDYIVNLLERPAFAGALPGEASGRGLAPDWVRRTETR